MKPVLIQLLLLFSIKTIHAQDDLAWLKECPIKKPQVFSSNQSSTPQRSAPKAFWKVSSKDSRQRLMTITNKTSSGSAELDPVQLKAIPVILTPTEESTAEDPEKTNPPVPKK